jgi:hypothetical protein
MAKRHGTREQKRHAKQKAKRRDKRRQLARRESSDPTVRLSTAERWPVRAAFVPDNLWTMGIGHFVIARRMPDGRLACGLFLVDVFCLGVKDATWKILSESELKDLRKYLEKHCRLQDAPSEYFAKLVYRAVDYAQSLGFPPHRDFRHAQRLLAGIDPSQCPDDFEFGQNGRPHYVRGPSESPLKSRSIAERVAAQGGHVTLHAHESELDEMGILDDELDDDYDEFDEFEIDAFEDDVLEEDEFDEIGSDISSPNDPIEPPPRRWWLPWR